MEHLDEPQAVSWLDYITKKCPENDITKSDLGTPTSREIDDEVCSNASSSIFDREFLGPLPWDEIHELEDDYFENKEHQESSEVEHLPKELADDRTPSDSTKSTKRKIGDEACYEKPSSSSDTGLLHEFKWRDVHKLEDDYFIECNTCKKCGIMCKYGLQSHQCSKQPHMQQGSKSSDENRNAFKQSAFAHSGGRKFNCDLCPYATNRKDYLRKHKLVHSSNRPFKCSHCSYSTKHKQSLKFHELNHLSERNFKCDLCPYATNINQYLKRHIVVHSIERKFKCSLCSFPTNYKHLS